MESTRYFIKYILNNELFEIQKLIKFCNISRTYKNEIEKNENVKNVLLFNKEIQEVLYYDNTKYDHLFYKRVIYKNNLKDIIDSYKNLEFPYIVSNTTNWENDSAPEKIYYSSKKLLPFEFSMFLDKLYEYPNVYIELYPINIIKKQINNICKEINEKLTHITNDSDLFGIIYLIPLMYSRHHKIGINEKSYILIMCYVNIVAEIQNTNSYICIKIDDYENETEHYNYLHSYLEKITRSITSSDKNDKITEFYYPQDVICKSANFIKIINKLLEPKNNKL